MNNFNGSELFWFGFACCLIVSVLMSRCNGSSNSGIYPHPTGEAVYLRGETCVINDLPEIDFQTMGAWCNAQRAGHE